jgi:hypothetical protein
MSSEAFERAGECARLTWQVNGKTMNKESPKADAPVPPAGTEQALSGALDQATQQPKPEESTPTADLIGDLISEALDVVVAILDN